MADDDMLLPLIGDGDPNEGDDSDNSEWSMFSEANFSPLLPKNFLANLCTYCAQRPKRSMTKALNGAFHFLGGIATAEQDDTMTATPNDISYDMSLPAQHIYLGNDLEELSGCTILEDDCILNLPLLILSNVVLIPGHTLPLQLYHPAAISMMKHAIDKDKTFGFINRCQVDENSLPKRHVVGTTAEVLSFKEEPDEDIGFPMLRVKAEGRQKFSIEESWRQIDGIIFAKCLILPEVALSNSLDCVKLESSLRFACKPFRGTSEQLCGGAPKILKKYDFSRFANLTWWPPWVYQQYDSAILMKKIKHEIKNWYTTLRLERTPSDPTRFSYWIAANIAINDDLKLNLLSIKSAVQRLRAELSILKRYNILACKICHSHIAQKDDVFSMSLTGPQGTYVNPGGFVHETITVHKVTGVVLIGRPSMRHSWFPWYAWIVAECKNCRTHLGWKFVTGYKTMKPEMFWGLCRSALQPDCEDSTDDKNWSPCM